MRTIYVIGKNYEEVDEWMAETGNTRFRSGVELYPITKLASMGEVGEGALVVCLDGATRKVDWAEMERELTSKGVTWLRA